MENLVDNFRKSFEEAYDRGKDHGFKCCFLQMKIHLGKYFLHEGKYKSADSMLEYILSLKLDDITCREEIKTPLEAAREDGILIYEDGKVGT
jgi:hypothetical protein